jgi:fructokinase
MNINQSGLFGGIEAGGTKFLCAVGTGPEGIKASTRFPTTTPEETIGKAIDFFKKAGSVIPLRAIGIASFGPVDPDPASSFYGYITSTPKAGWSHTNLAGTVRDALGIPILLDTDVNAAALGEYKWGAAKGLDDFIYITVGTGIGGGGIINGKPMHGMIHPEMGHTRIPHDRRADPFTGSCPFHGDCLEGLASGESIEKRWSKRPEALPPDHPAWELEATYLALGLANFICTLSPKRIVLGGGVMKKPGLLEMVRSRVVQLLNNYIGSPEINERIDDYIVAPGLGDMSGVLGAIALAQSYNPNCIQA